MDGMGWMDGWISPDKSISRSPSGDNNGDYLPVNMERGGARDAHAYKNGISTPTCVVSFDFPLRH